MITNCCSAKAVLRTERELMYFSIRRYQNVRKHRFNAVCWSYLDLMHRLKCWISLLGYVWHKKGILKGDSGWHIFTSIRRRREGLNPIWHGGHDGPQNVFDHCAEAYNLKTVKNSWNLKTDLYRAKAEHSCAETLWSRKLKLFDF